MRKLLVDILDVMLFVATVIVVLFAFYLYGPFGAGVSLIACALFGGLWCAISLIYENTKKANEISQKHLDLLALLQKDMEQSVIKNTTKANEISQKHLDVLELLQKDMEQSVINQLQSGAQRHGVS